MSDIEIIVKDETYSRMLKIPVPTTDADDCINFLIDHYYKHAELSKAQQILTEEDSLQ